MSAPEWKTLPVNWQDRTRAVVVGIDGSAGNEAAIAFAIDEALSAGRPMTLLAVHVPRVVPTPHQVLALEDEDTWCILDRAVKRTRAGHPELTVRLEMQVGDPVDCLLDRSVGQGMLITGRRGLGSFGRVFLGSTSTGVAGRSWVPVIMVPGDWDAQQHRGQPVLVGADPGQPCGDALRFAFAEADRRDVGVTVLHALDLTPRPIWDPDLETESVRAWQERAAKAVDEAVDPVHAEFPHVPVRISLPLDNPASALLDAAAEAQLVVLGRHHSGRLGFALGSVARPVLHYAEAPVSVVPSRSPA